MATAQKIQRLAAITQQLKTLEKRVQKAAEKEQRLKDEAQKLIRSIPSADRALYAEKIAKYSV